MSEVALTGYVYQPPTAQARADLVLGSPRGRLLLAGCLGYAFSDALHEQRDVTPPQVRAIAGAAMAGREWRGLLDLDEFGLLAVVAGAHPDLGGAVAGPADWQALVSAFPTDVTGTHAGEWHASTGLPGPWRLPDWEQVMQHYDGVHLTIGGYLACGGIAPPAGGGYTMLTGWIPDATLWLRDVTTGQRRLGRWYGDPQGTGTWDDLAEAFIPDDQ